MDVLVRGRNGEISGARMAEFGNVLLAIGRVEEGMRAIRTALRLEGRSVGARGWRGRLGVAERGVVRARERRRRRRRSGSVKGQGGGRGHGEETVDNDDVDDDNDDVDNDDEAYDAQLDILVGD
jgi:hypothetical protein